MDEEAVEAFGKKTKIANSPVQKNEEMEQAEEFSPKPKKIEIPKLNL